MNEPSMHPEPESPAHVCGRDPVTGLLVDPTRRLLTCIERLLRDANADLLFNPKTPVALTGIERTPTTDPHAVMLLRFLAFPQHAQPLEEDPRTGNPAIEHLCAAAKNVRTRIGFKSDEMELYRSSSDTLVVVLHTGAAQAFLDVRESLLRELAMHRMPGCGIPYQVAAGSMSLYTAVWHTAQLYRWIKRQIPEGRARCVEVLRMWNWFTLERARRELAVAHGIQLTQVLARPDVWANLCTYQVRWQVFHRATLLELQQCSELSFNAIKYEGDAQAAQQYWKRLHRDMVRVQFDELDTQLRQPGDDVYLARIVYVLQMMYPWLVTQP